MRPDAGARTGPRVIILGAGRSTRGSEPSAVFPVRGAERVLDWLLAAFGLLGDAPVSFVGGYQAREVAARYPRLRFVENAAWSTTGPVASLALVLPDVQTESYISYADIVFRPAAVAALRDTPGDVVLAIDTRWRERYEGRGLSALEKAERVRLGTSGVAAVGRQVALDDADAEFVGLLRLSRRATETASRILSEGRLLPSASLPELIAALIGGDVGAVAVDLEGDWAELDAPQDLARFVLGTKAESLARLSGMDHGGHIGPLVAFSARAWHESRASIISTILALPAQSLIVRSSARSEDGWAASEAGRYDSIPRVERTSHAIGEAVDAVIRSYRGARDDDQVLVQEWLPDVICSGVVMTRTHGARAPYYVINFDDRRGTVGAVTSGREARTVFQHRAAPDDAALPPALRGLLDTVRRIEALVGHDSLDVEFAVTPDEVVHVLQVRPIALTGPAGNLDAEVAAAIDAARSFVAGHLRPSSPLVGGGRRYSVMADWNPAEILGTKPRALALSLYRHLVTDEVWARQRAEYGYRDVRPAPLLVEIAGHPYIDVCASFSSFMPAALPADLAGRLVDASIARLAGRPAWHDKVEFEVVFTCLTADFDVRAAERLAPFGFSGAEIGRLREALRDITAGGISRVPRDLARVAACDGAITRALAQPLAPQPQARVLLEAARDGALAFAHLARSAFVATDLLRSLRTIGVLTDGDVRDLLRSVRTVFGQIREDGWRVHDGSMAWDAFVARYGHLRPGTYDITAPSYGAQPERYLRPLVVPGPRPAPPLAPAWHEVVDARVTPTLRSAGLPIDAGGLESFVREAVAGREQGKFVFTRALSAALECVAAFGEAVGMTRDDLAHLRVDALFGADPAEAGALAEAARTGRAAHRLVQMLCLPAQIARPADVTAFEQEQAEPNFVTERVTEGPVRVEPQPEAALEGHIVLVPNADPGHDWLLAREIAGLVTMYGGANSHMAVRAAEAGLPAAIGVGAGAYASLESAEALRLDCASRVLTVIR